MWWAEPAVRAWRATCPARCPPRPAGCRELFLGMEYGCTDPMDPEPLAKALQLGEHGAPALPHPAAAAGCQRADGTMCNHLAAWATAGRPHVPGDAGCARGSTAPHAVRRLAVSSRLARCSPPVGALCYATLAADHAVQQDGQEFMKLFLSLLETRFEQQDDLKVGRPTSGGQALKPLLARCASGSRKSIWRTVAGK